MPTDQRNVLSSTAGRFLLCMVLMSGGGSLAAQEPAAGGRYIVRGLTDLDPVQLARSLEADDNLLLLSGPLTARKTFLAAVAEHATLALQRQGFAAAKATATIEGDAAAARVIVNVVEGPRQMAGGIEITGLPDDLAEKLRRWLKSPRPPPAAVPQAFDVEGGWSGTRWLDQRGQPARMDPPAWSRDQPAPCDVHELTAVRNAIARFLREHGYFSGSAAFDVAVRPGEEVATLVIKATNLPPASVLAGIDIFPGARATTGDLQAFLGITPGGTVTERDRLAWRESLRLSGRFVKHEITFREAPAADGKPPGMVAVFDLAAYPHAPPLSEPLSREEMVVLSFRTWLLQTLANDDDLILTWTLPQADGRPAEPRRPVGSLVVSTQQGILLTALPGSDDACGVAVSDAGLGWFLPRAAGRFEIPLPEIPLASRKRIVAHVSLFLAETIETGRHKYPRRFDVGYGLEPRPRDAAAVALMAQIEPVACVAFLHEGSPQVSWDGQDLVVVRPEMTARFDSRTGRLVSLEVPDGGSIAIDAAPDRFAADLAPLRAAAGDDRVRPDALVSSGVDFFTGEAARNAVAHLVEAAGLSHRTAAWQERLAVAAGKLRRTAAAGGFAATDRVVAEAMAAAEAAAEPLLPIPAAEPVATAADPAATLARVAAAKAWRWMERACGAEAWPAALARIGALAARSDPAVIWELSAFMTGKRNGPLAFLAASAAAPMPAMAASLARQGQTRLTTAAFHDDCRPLLEILRCSGIDRCAVGLLRTIDDEEATLLGRTFAQDETILLPLVQAVRSHDSDDAAVAALPDALDHWWQESLDRLVAAALAGRAEIRTADKPAPEAATER